MSQAPEIIVNCQRTHSNLLQIVAEFDGLYLFYLNQKAPDMEPVLVGEGDFIDFEANPEAKEIVTVTNFTTYWNPDMLWSIATVNEDCSVTPLGHTALQDDNLWKSDAPDFRNPSQQADVA